MRFARERFMNFLRRFKYLAYSLVLLSLVGFTYATQNYSLMVLAVAATALSWWLVETGKGPPIPRWLINCGVLLAALILFWELVILRQPNLLLALGYFILGLILCKLFEVKSNRDYGQILILSLLLMLAAAILTVSPIFAVFLLAYFGLGLYVSLIFHLQCETQRAMARHAAADRMMGLASQQWVIARDLRRLSILTGGFLFFFACMVFVLFPRTGVGGILTHWRIGGERVETGFSSRVTMGQVGRLRQSNAIVATVRLEKNGKNIGSEGYQPYFMGKTLNFYNPITHEWKRSSPSWKSQDQTFHLKKHEHATALARPTTYQPRSVITQYYSFLNPVRNRALFTIAPAVWFKCAGLKQVIRRDDGSLMCPPLRRKPLHYEVRSAAVYNRALIGPRQPRVFPVSFRYRHSHPGGNFSRIPSAAIPRRVAALAKKVAGRLLKIRRTPSNAGKVDLELASRFCNYLRANYPYSFDMTPVNPRMDPTEDFLLNKKKIGGYCEYFASAMIMFCRSAGIPARMVIGYHGGDYNPIAGYYVIRQKFAHAWVQVYIPGRGWMQFDPSPISSLIGVESPFTWYSEITGFFQWIRLQWLQSIVAFNSSMRSNVLHTTLEDAKKDVKKTLAAARHWLEVIQMFWRSRQISPLARSALIGLLIALAASAFWIGSRWRKKRQSVLGQVVHGLDRKLQRQLTRDLAFFDRLLQVLQHGGIRREPNQTPLEYVQQVGNRTGEPLPEAEELVRIFYEIRLGSQQVSSGLGRQIKQNLSDLENRLKKQTFFSQRTRL